MENACFYDYEYKELNIVIIKTFSYTVITLFMLII